MRSMIPIIFAIAAPLSGANPSEHTGWYQVEAILFAQNTYDAAIPEQFDHIQSFAVNPQAVDLNQQLGASGNFNIGLGQSYQRPTNVPFIQGSGEWSLTSAAQRLESSGNYQVLWHQSWNHFITDPGVQPPLKIELLNDQGYPALQAEIQLHVRRYLHANVRMAQFVNYRQPSYGNILMFDPTQIEAKPERIVVLEEKRRLGSNQTHYFDHPKLGILLRISPIDNKVHPEQDPLLNKQ